MLEPRTVLQTEKKELNTSISLSLYSLVCPDVSKQLHTSECQLLDSPATVPSLKLLLGRCLVAAKRKVANTSTEYVITEVHWHSWLTQNETEMVIGKPDPRPFSF